MREQIAVDGFMLPGRVIGTGFDGVLLMPLLLRGGPVHRWRYPLGQRSGRPVPRATEFAQDATFGYTSSNLRDFVAEKSGGTITSDEVHSISLDRHPAGWARPGRRDLGRCHWWRLRRCQRHRLRRPGDRRPRALGGAGAGEVVRIPLRSVVPPCAGRARAPRPADRRADLAAGRPGGHGLVVVGSHVGLTSRQVAKAQERGGMTETELHVPTLIDSERRDAMSPTSGGRSSRRSPPPMCCCSPAAPCCAAATPRQPGDLPHRLHRGHRGGPGRTAAHPAWVVAKGGITSHDVAVRGLGIRRAEVLGQLLPGLVSVFRPSRRHRKPSAPPTWCSPAMSVTTTPSPTSSTFSPDADELRPTCSIHNSQKETADMTNVGWIGLGAMGSPMASFVAKAGHAVTAFDIDPQKAVALQATASKPRRPSVTRQSTPTCWC